MNPSDLLAFLRDKVAECFPLLLLSLIVVISVTVLAGALMREARLRELAGRGAFVEFRVAGEGKFRLLALQASVERLEARHESENPTDLDMTSKEE